MASQIQEKVAGQADNIVCAAEAGGGGFMGLINIPKDNGVTECLFHLPGGYCYSTEQEAVTAAEDYVQQAKEAVSGEVVKPEEPEDIENVEDKELEVGDKLIIEDEDGVRQEYTVKKIGKRYATLTDSNGEDSRVPLEDLPFENLE